MANLAAVMWCRLLQKRWMLTLVFWLSLIYFLTSAFKQKERAQLLLEHFPSWAAVVFYNLFMVVEVHLSCLAKCKTWFQSMQHENTDRNPIAKYC
ncbi:SREBP regulating gene protein-like isoform X1 [Choloepus didactylus]|uniref:SREBP regulating gene protein-like isoform X1 n=1 Tax=Choloepus didactylus TaxID=27675 RepID=UPI0018A0E841|nr:SREBP regulating gene protein-like isoform X1 [Choloepus didactylus]